MNLLEARNKVMNHLDSLGIAADWSIGSDLAITVYITMCEHCKNEDVYVCGSAGGYQWLFDTIKEQYPSKKALA